MRMRRPQSLARALSLGSIAVWLLLVLPRGARADLHFLEPMADAGTVNTGKPLSHKFTFVNRGQESVDVTEARASCGCLTPRMAKRQFQPGEDGFLLLEVNTLNQSSGTHHWRLQVSYTSGGTQYQMLLELNANVIAEVTVDPAALTVYADSAVHHEIRLTDLRDKALTVADVRTSSANLKSRVAGQYRDALGHQVRTISLEVAGDFTAGRHDEILTIVTDDPNYGELKVPVTIIKRPRQRVTATPNQVTLMAPSGQAVGSHIVLIRDREEQGVVVDRVVTDHPAVHCQWAQGPGSNVTLKITIDRHQLVGGSLQTNVTVHVRQPVEETLTIPVSCTLE